MIALEVDNVTVHANRAQLLESVSLRLGTGELVALVGPNGAGKTSLIRTALGLLQPTRGKVLLGGKPIGHLRARERAALAAWLPQQSGIVEDLTALELVSAARYRFQERRAMTLAAAKRALQRAGVESLAERLVTGLSGGEQQRVALAALLAQEAPLLLLDEPANHLDPAQQIALYELIGDLWREGMSVLCITHDVNLLAHAARERAADVRVLGLRKGALAFDSRLDAPELATHLSQLFDLPLVTLLHEGRRLFVSSTGAS
jgi:iron complex transport system ATP-binding protein